MQTLIAISIFSFLAIFLAGVAIARNIRAARKRITIFPQQHSDFAQHLISATEGKNLSRSRAVPEQTLQQVMSNKSWNQPHETMALRPTAKLQTSYDRNIHQTTTRKPEAAQSSQRAVSKRLDLPNFDGDLRDQIYPYQTSRLQAISRDKAPSPKRF
jgi:hypothetical protein